MHVLDTNPTLAKHMLRALAQRLRERAATRQAEDAAEAQRRERVARERNSANANCAKPANAAKPNRHSARPPNAAPPPSPSRPVPSSPAARRQPRPRRRAPRTVERRACTALSPSLGPPSRRLAHADPCSSLDPRKPRADRAGTTSTPDRQTGPGRRPKPPIRAAWSHHPSQHPGRLFARSSSQSS